MRPHPVVGKSPRQLVQTLGDVACRLKSGPKSALSGLFLTSQKVFSSLMASKQNDDSTHRASGTWRTRERATDQAAGRPISDNHSEAHKLPYRPVGLPAEYPFFTSVKHSVRHPALVLLDSVERTTHRRSSVRVDPKKERNRPERSCTLTLSIPLDRSDLILLGNNNWGIPIGEPTRDSRVENPDRIPYLCERVLLQNSIGGAS